MHILLDISTESVDGVAYIKLKFSVSFCTFGLELTFASGTTEVECSPGSKWSFFKLKFVVFGFKIKYRGLLKCFKIVVKIMRNYNEASQLQNEVKNTTSQSFVHF